MDLKLEERNLIINDEQAEMFAYNIFRDIGEYLKIHTLEYFKWFVSEILGKEAENYIVTMDGIVERKPYNYTICQYNNVEVIL